MVAREVSEVYVSVLVCEFVSKCVCVCVIYRILPRRTKALLGKMIQLTRNHQLLQRYILNYSISWKLC